MRKKVAALVLTLGLALCFTGCGDKKDDSGNSGSTQGSSQEATTEAPKGKTESWGNYSEFFVPEGMKYTPGSQIDKEDQKAFWIQKEDDPMKYYLFGETTAEQAEKDVQTTMDLNKSSNPTEVTLKAGDYEWKGVTYKYSGTTDVSMLYAEIGGKTINVRIGGYAYDEDSTKAILASIKVK